MSTTRRLLPMFWGLLLMTSLLFLLWTPPNETLIYHQIATDGESTPSHNNPQFSEHTDTTPLLTIFTSFKEREDRQLSHSCAVVNWAALRPWAQPVLFTSLPDSALVRQARLHGWDVHPVPRRNRAGTPVLRDMFYQAYEKYDSEFYAYSNGDLYFNSEGLKATLTAVKRHHNVTFNTAKDQRNISYKGLPFVVGRRRNIIINDFNMTDPLPDYCHSATVGDIGARDKYPLDIDYAMDYFITARHGFPWAKTPKFVIGRVGFDQYLMAAAKYYNLSTVDASLTNPAVHLRGPHRTLNHYGDADDDYSFNAHMIKMSDMSEGDLAMGSASAAGYYSVNDVTGDVSLVKRAPRNKTRVVKTTRIPPEELAAMRIKKGSGFSHLKFSNSRTRN